MRFLRQRTVDRFGLLAAPGRRQRARAPVPPRRVLRQRRRHGVDRGEHVVPGPGAQRRAHAPFVLDVVQRRARGLAEPVVRLRLELPCGVIGQPGVAVLPVGLGETVTLPHPGGAYGACVRPRGALEGVEGEVPSSRPVPRKVAVRERARRVALDLGELARGDAVRARERLGDRLRQADVSRFHGQAIARAAIGRRELAAVDQCREQRVAGIRRRPAGEPEGLRLGQRGVAVALAVILDAVALELDVLVRRRGIVERERRPVAALPQPPSASRRAGGRRAACRASAPRRRGHRRASRRRARARAANRRRRAPGALRQTASPARQGGRDRPARRPCARRGSRRRKARPAPGRRRRGPGGRRPRRRERAGPAVLARRK